MAEREERPIADSGGKNKQKPVAKKETPLATFRKLLGDFSEGIRSLRRLSARTAVPPAARNSGVVGSKQGKMVEPSSTYVHNETGKNYHVDFSKPTKPVGVASSGKSADFLTFRSEKGPKYPDSRPYSKGTPAPTPHTIRIHSVSAPVYKHKRSRQLPLGDMRNSPIVSGADREARERFSSSADIARIPSAARLAQILRADSLMRTGELPANPSIQNMAQAIREGRRREIADKSPEEVQRVLHEATGGPERAKQLLSTPAVHRLIERHQTSLQAQERLLHEVHKRAERNRTTHSAHERTTHVEHQSHHFEHLRDMARRGIVSPSSISQLPHAPKGENSDLALIGSSAREESELLGMISTNEEPHDRMVAQSMEREITMSGRASSPSPQKPRNVAATISAPARSKPKSETAPPAASTAPGGGRQQIDGKLEIVVNGQKVGEGTLTGDIR